MFNIASCLRINTIWPSRLQFKWARSGKQFKLCTSLRCILSHLIKIYKNNIRPNVFLIFNHNLSYFIYPRKNVSYIFTIPIVLSSASYHKMLFEICQNLKNSLTPLACRQHVILIIFSKLRCSRCVQKIYLQTLLRNIAFKQNIIFLT